MTVVAPSLTLDVESQEELKPTFSAAYAKTESATLLESQEGLKLFF